MQRVRTVTFSKGVFQAFYTVFIALSCVKTESVPLSFLLFTKKGFLKSKYS